MAFTVKEQALEILTGVIPIGSFTILSLSAH